MMEAAHEAQMMQAESAVWSATEVLRWGFERFGSRLAVVSAFGAEGMVLIDLASHLRASFRVITVDTGFLFPETYELIPRVERRYGIRIERCQTELDPAAQERAYGAGLWARDPDRCCDLRKVQPLREKLKELDAWASGIRRDQTSLRAGTPKIEWDAKFGLVKLNPLASWSSKQIWAHLHAHAVPYNPLHDAGFASIGCTHCTRAIRPGEDARAGRWPDFAKTECGLHVDE